MVLLRTLKILKKVLFNQTLLTFFCSLFFYNVCLAEELHEKKEENTPLQILLDSNFDVSLDKSSFGGTYAIWKNNLRFALDLSSRVNYVEGGDRYFYQNFLGFDLHKVFSSDSGDIGTLLLQGYMTRIDDLQGAPSFFEGEDDWEFIPRIFNFNYTALTRGTFNIRVGHFEIPYGLEQPINTNGTLFDFIHGRNIGVKPDWGITANGIIEDIEYEVALSRGTGIEYHQSGDPYIASGRVSTLQSENFVLGVSALYGEVKNQGAVRLYNQGVENTENQAVGDIIRRSRFGFDMQWYTGQWAILGETSFGRDFNQDVFNNLLQLQRNSLRDDWFVYLQLVNFNQRFSEAWDNQVQTRLGFDYRPDNKWSISAQYSHTLEQFNNTSRNALVSFQLRYRFEVI